MPFLFIAALLSHAFFSRALIVPVRSRLTPVGDSGTKVPHPKQIMKRIQSCGKNYTTALEVLYETHPFLAPSALGWEFASFHETFDAKPICGIIKLLSQNEEHALALDLLEKTIKRHQAKIVPTFYLLAVYKSIIILTKTIKSQGNGKIMEYLYNDIPYHTNRPVPMHMYHAAISSLGKCRKMDSILNILNDFECGRRLSLTTFNGTHLTYNLPKPDRMMYLTALTGSIACKSSTSSIEIMNRMSNQQMIIDRVVYNQVLSSLANHKSENRYEMARMVWRHMEFQGSSMDAKDKTLMYKTLISIFTKENQWKDVAAVKDKINGDATTALPVLPYGDAANPLMPGYIEDLVKLVKVDGVKKNWYKLGRVKVGFNSQAIFGLQTHKNPHSNGVSLVFYSSSGQKLGFLLIRNSIQHVDARKWPVPEEGQRKLLHSSIMGMQVDPAHRGRGLAKIFVAVWLLACRNSDAVPRSETINKPLLSLVLSNFGFSPVSEGAIDVEIGPIENVQDAHYVSNGRAKNESEPLFALYSSSALNFGKRDLRIQRMIVTRYPLNPRGKLTAVKTAFEHLKWQELARKKQNGKNCLEEEKELDAIIKRPWINAKKTNGSETHENNVGEGCIEFDIDNELLRRVVFGYLY